MLEFLESCTECIAPFPFAQPVGGGHLAIFSYPVKNLHWVPASKVQYSVYESAMLNIHQLANTS